MAKLSDKEVDRLRDLSNKGMSGIELSEQFGISRGHVSRIINGKRR